jgi:hypothetical protein
MPAQSETYVSDWHPKLGTVELVARLQDTVKRTTLPRSVRRLPPDICEKKAGTLKIMEGLTLARIHLPLALIRHWSTEMPDPADFISPLSHAALGNTMSLVQAIHLAFKNTTLAERIKRGQQHYTDYLTSLQSEPINCYGRKMVSVHHIGYHVFDFMTLFGPVPNWWCLPFEKVIGDLQKMTQNHIPGKLMTLSTAIFVLISTVPGQWEAGVHKKFLAAGKFVRWFTNTCSPGVRFFRERIYNRFLRSMWSQGDPDLEDGEDLPPRSPAEKTPDELRHLVPQPKVNVRANLRINGSLFSRESTHTGNSQIIFCESQDDMSPHVYGTVKYIIWDGHKHVLAVNRWLPLPHGVNDPFRHWPDFPARMMSSLKNSHLQLVDLPCVLGQYARCPLSPDYAAVVSLIWVRSCLSVELSSKRLIHAPRTDHFTP